MTRVAVTVVSCAVSPSALSMYVQVKSGAWAGQVVPIEIAHDRLGAWVDELRMQTTGKPTGSLVGENLELEYDGKGLAAVWTVHGVRLPLPGKESDPAPVDESRLHSAVKYVNRKREGIQAPLMLADTGAWSTRANPWERWTDADVIAEAERLGWRP